LSDPESATAEAFGIAFDLTVELAFVVVDYRNRLEPTEILAALQALAKESKTQTSA
jgi:hypothetical protein